MSYLKSSVSKKWPKKDSSNSYVPRVRKREPLATEEQKQSMSVSDLSYDFAKRIIYLHQFLTQESKDREYKLADQVYRSGTSVGANVRESNHAQSAPDFLSKMQIALKECDETEYWLTLLHAGDYLTDRQFESIHDDCIRLIKVLTSIVGTTSKKIKESKSK